MTKVAYNACFGSFSLSRKAVELGRKLSGDPKWGGVVLPGENFDDGSLCTGGLGMDMYHLDYKHPRHDPILIRVIEKLGRKANGECAQLKITEVSGPYRIDEYDGSERVMTAGDYDWVRPC